MDELVLICEDSIEGILNGVYEAYRLKKENRIESHALIHLAAKQPGIRRLFTQYQALETDFENAEKVIRTLKQRFGNECYYQLCLAMASDFEDKADAVYHTIVLGLAANDRAGRVLERLGEDCVQRTFFCARAAKNELGRMIQFTRFMELEGGILYAKIDAKHHILPFLMPHFADRLPSENFIIYDERSDMYGLHPSRREWYLAQGVELDGSRLKLTAGEQEYQELFVRFCKSIAIESRRNEKLQTGLLPLRFRPNMTEFQNSK